MIRLRAHGLGAALRLFGEVALDDGTAGIMLHHPELAIPNRILVDGRDCAGADGSTRRFDVTVPLDLLQGGMQRLGFLRMRRDGGIEPAPANLVALVLSGMQPGGLNHAHMIDTLARLQRPRPPLLSMLPRFESLGDNCEFGVFTKAFGNRRPSLLGYGGTAEWMSTPRRSIAPLCTALLTAFDGLGVPGDLSFERHRGEWISRSKRFDFVFHSGLIEDLEVDELEHRESRRLLLVRRKFLQDFANPAKIFVRRSNGNESEADMRQLRAAMDRLGPAWLLWVDHASEAEPAITATLLGERLLKVSHAALRGYDQADDPDLDRWSETVEAAFMAAELLGPGWKPGSIAVG